MTQESIKEAVKQAREFIRRADATLKVDEWVTGSRESGALRRQSMELTRALAAMRKP